MPDPHTRDDPEARAQRERARRTWQLEITAPAEALSPDDRRALWAALRVKRFEREQWLARLPGPVRSGAEVDLRPLHTQLVEAGVPCRLARRDPEPPSTPQDAD